MLNRAASRTQASSVILMRILISKQVGDLCADVVVCVVSYSWLHTNGRSAVTSSFSAMGTPRAFTLALSAGCVMTKRRSSLHRIHIILSEEECMMDRVSDVLVSVCVRACATVSST